MSKQVANIHDVFFKQVMSDPSLADTFLREHLPGDVAELLGPELAEPLPASFIDEELRQHHCDLLFRVRLKSDCDAYTYVLVEHKSSPDPAARLQLLRYVVLVLIDRYNKNAQKLPLPVVLPLLAHHGPEGWNLSCEFADMFGTVPESLRPYVPSFRHALVDLGHVEDRVLSTNVRLRAFLKALKYRLRRDLDDWLEVILAEAAGLGERDLSVILIYLETGPTALSDKVTQEALDRLVSNRKERIVGPITRPYYEKGKAEGRTEGQAEGRIEGEARLLARLLERRFGALPPSARQRIFTADLSSIEAWFERVFDAADLDSVFDPSRTNIEAPCQAPA